MTHTLQEVLQRFQELDRLLAERAAEAQTPQYTGWLKERARLAKIAARHEVLESVRKQLAQARELESDPELGEAAREDIAKLSAQETRFAAELEAILEGAGRPAIESLIIEVRPGTGGEEAALFAGDLFRMYTKYIQRRGWKMDVLDLTPSDLGGIRNATISVDAEDAYDRLRFESGTHRVQRVPKTEAQGRIHTSAATVAVLPEVEDVEVKIDPKELRIDTYSAGGPGGQHVNKTQSAVRITHLPTGVVVACQNERSQIRNRDLAMRWLKAKLLEHRETEQKEKIDSIRRNQIGTGDRSEKIRTYNFPQSRVTDHRITFSLHNLEKFLDGDLDEMLDALAAADRDARNAKKP